MCRGTGCPGTALCLQAVLVHQSQQVPFALLGGAQVGDVRGEVVGCTEVAVAVADVQEQADELFVGAVARLAGETGGESEIGGQGVRGAVRTGLVGEGEPLVVVGPVLVGCLPGGVDVLVVQQASTRTR